MKYSRRLAPGIVLLAIGLLTACAGFPVSPNKEERQSLAPSGLLRIGIHNGSPTKDVIIDIGKALSERLGVGFELVQYSTQPELLTAISDGKVDFTGTNASPARAARMDFTSTVLDIELGYMVVPASPVKALGDVDRVGVRVGVTQGSTSLVTLPKLFKHATVISTTPSKSASQLFLTKEIDAFATNKTILNDLSRDIPNSSILEGNWGYEHWAICIPKGRQIGFEYLEKFVRHTRSSGLVDKSIEKSNLRWVVVPKG